MNQQEEFNLKKSTMNLRERLLSKHINQGSRTIRWVQRENVKENIIQKFIKNELMSPQLRSYQKASLNNIPIQQHLLDKALFKFRQEEERKKIRQLSNEMIKSYRKDIKQSDSRIREVLKYGKLRGVRLGRIDNLIECYNSGYL